VGYQEESVGRETVVRMIPNIRPVGDAIVWAPSEDAAADKLGVEASMLASASHR
jgi:hypothetical protein